MSDAAGGVDLSVVIPCLNVASDLPQQLDALARQDWPGTWEVVIADNGSTDATVTVAQSFAVRLPRVRVVDASAMRGRHHACNVGAAHALGRSIVFVDADDEVAPGYLAAMDRGLARNAVVAARLDHTRDPVWMSGVGSDVQTTGLQNGLGFLPFGCGASLGFDKRAFDAIGGFREHATYCEDVDICWRAQLDGYELAFLDDAVITYRSRPTVRQMYRQHRNYARAWPLLYREFCNAGMARRSTRAALAEWGTIMRSVPRLRSRTEAARWARRLGRSVGRLEGSVRYLTWYP